MVGTRVRAKLRHRTTLRLGGDRPRQNKQTVKYLLEKKSRVLFLKMYLKLCYCAETSSCTVSWPLRHTVLL